MYTHVSSCEIYVMVLTICCPKMCHHYPLVIISIASLRSGADVNAKTTLGRTALHAASAQGHGSILDLLLEYGKTQCLAHFLFVFVHVMLQPPSLCCTRLASHVRVLTYTATAPYIRARTCSVCCCAQAPTLTPRTSLATTR